MESKKKNYLFKVGPLVFFPKQTEEEKYQVQQDTKEFNRNVLRLAIIIGYGIVSIGLTRTAEVGRMFTESRPLYHYLIFVAPLVFSIMDWRVIREATKTVMPIPLTTRTLIYGVWLISAAYCLIYIYRLIAK